MFRRSFWWLAVKVALGLIVGAWICQLPVLAQNVAKSRVEALSRVMATHARNADRLLELPDVVGVGVGMGAQDRPVLKVFTRKG